MTHFLCVSGHESAKNASWSGQLLNKYSCLIKLKVEAGQGSITLLDYTFVNVIVKHWNNTITSNIFKKHRIINKVLESVENIFLIQFCGSSFAEFFVTGCLIMTSPFWSLLLCSVLICGQPIGQSVIYTRRCLFHNAHQNMCVYCNFNIL